MNHKAKATQTQRPDLAPDALLQALAHYGEILLCLENTLALIQMLLSQLSTISFTQFNAMVLQQ